MKPFVALLLLLGPVQGAVIYSGAQNLAIPLTFDGIYLNIATGATSAVQPPTWNTAPWINPFFAGVFVGNDALLRPVITGTDQVVNLAIGTTINAGSNFVAGESGSTTHIGAGANQFAIGVEGILGFAFEAAVAGPTRYGWTRVTFENTQPGRIYDWAYDDSGGAIVTGLVRQSLPVSSAQTVTLSPGAGQDFSLGSVVSDTGGNVNSVVKTGTGTTTLLTTNTHTGTTTINGGALSISSDGNLGTAPGALVAAHLTLNGGALKSTATFSTAATRGVTLGSAGGTVEVAASTTLTIPAPIAGAGGLSKSGPGTVLLSGASTFGGDTEVNAGTLLVTGSVSGDVKANNTGTVGGTGSVGTLHANAGGSIAPGVPGVASGLGDLMVGGAVTLMGGSTFSLEIRPSTITNDHLTTLGNLLIDLANTAELSISVVNADTHVPLGTRFPFMSYSGTWNGGLFQVFGSPIADDVSYFQVGQNVFAIDYNDGGNSVALVAVPEPSVAGLLIAGAALGLARRRKR